MAKAYNHSWKIGRKGEKCNTWKGDKVSYIGIHAWLYREFGKANKCVNCSGISGSVKFEWANISGKYKRDLNDWIMLCKICHNYIDNVYEKMWETRRRKSHA